MAEDSERRFHAIMDKLFNPPTKSKSMSPPPPSSTEAQATNTPEVSRLSPTHLSSGMKRPRLESVLSIVDQNSSSSSALGENVQTPQCRPWDRDDLLKRLGTFKSMTWFAKPKVVSAVNCARRGWVNIDVDIIACEACGARLLFSTPSSWTQHQVEKAALVFSLKLNSGHKLFCPWVDNACEERLAQFPAFPPAVLVENYKKRCSTLLQLSSLPVISLSSIDSIRIPLLEHFLHVAAVPEYDTESASISRTESFCVGSEDAASPVLYYQAQKLISLCGWEPRTLAYVVDRKNQQCQPFKGASHSNISNGVSDRQNHEISVHSVNIHEDTGCNHIASIDVQYEPNSVVLDCQLCGASVGLWAFTTVQRPVEFLRLMGHSEVNGKNGGDLHKASVGGNNGDQSIAGTENAALAGSVLWNYKPSNLQLTIAGGPPASKQNFRATISLPVIGRNLRAWFSSESMDNLSCANSQGPEDQGISLERANVGEKGISETSKSDARAVCQFETNDAAEEGSIENEQLPVMAEVLTAYLENENPCGSQIGVSSDTTPDCHVAVENDETSLNGTNLQEPDHCDPQKISRADMPSCGEGENLGDSGGVETIDGTSNHFEKDLKQRQLDDAVVFDPIKQHRHFCPWIASSENSAPGWKHTLYALQRQKEFSFPSPENASLSPSFIEVDDPVTSVKRLFMSPSAKRRKHGDGGSR